MRTIVETHDTASAPVPLSADSALRDRSIAPIEPGTQERSIRVKIVHDLR